MQNLNTYKNQGYLILDGENKFDLKNLKELTTTFDGYNKVIFYLSCRILPLFKAGDECNTFPSEARAC